ncbi:MAG: hypothetical protein NXH72_10290 [Hyphomonadaceae bacterium]|nr:hypothetical protein [Hyphomonadaceae bacterium]
MDQETNNMMERVTKLGEMSETEARRIVNETYKDGIVSRGEAEALFRINDVLKSTDPEWSSRFQEALKDYLLTREPPEGWVTDEEADWLLAQVHTDEAKPSLEEIDLLLAILRQAEGAPQKLAHYTIEAISARIIADGVANLNMVERMRYALYAGSSDGGLWVTAFEAGILFKTNDGIANARNASTWNDLFARAVGNHLMARAHPDPKTVENALSREAWLKDTSGSTGGFFARMGASFTNGSWFEKVTYNGDKAAKARMAAAEAAAREAEKVTADENSWLLRRLGWDEKISPAENALIEFLKKEAPGFTQGLVIAA